MGLYACDTLTDHLTLEMTLSFVARRAATSLFPSGCGRRPHLLGSLDARRDRRQIAEVRQAGGLAFQGRRAEMLISREANFVTGTFQVDEEGKGQVSRRQSIELMTIEAALGLFVRSILSHENLAQNNGEEEAREPMDRLICFPSLNIERAKKMGQNAARRIAADTPATRVGRRAELDRYLRGWRRRRAKGLHLSSSRRPSSSSSSARPLRPSRRPSSQEGKG